MLNARQRIFLAFLVAGALVSLLAWVVFLPNAARAQAQPALNLTVAPTTISENNGMATITVAITNNVVFATDQVIALSFAGTAIPSDFTVEDASNFALTSPYQLILAAGGTSVTGTIKPVDDDVYEGDETIEVAASLGGTAIGSAQTVTVTDEADRARVTSMHRLDAGEFSDDVVDLWPFIVLVIFDRDVRGLKPHELAITNGRALSVRPQLSGNRSRYVVTIQATGTSGEEVRVHVPENVVDGGNAPSASSMEYRGTITGDDGELISMTTSAAQPVTELFQVVLTFGADVCWGESTGAEDNICTLRPLSQHLQPHHFVVTGGSAGGLNSGHGRAVPDDEIHLNAIPDADYEGKMVLVLPEYAAATQSGGRTGGGRLEVEVDTLGPELLSASVTGDGLTLSYHEFLGQVPPTSALTVTVAGTAVSVTRITLNGAALILELDQSVTPVQETLVSYTQLGAGIEDEHGNLALGVSDFEADTGAGSRAPSLSSAEIRGSVLTLNFDEPLYPFSQPDQGDFTVAVAGSAAVINSASLSGVSVIITLANEVQAGQVVLVSYTPGSSPIEDFGNTPAAAFSGESVTNATPVTIPVLSSAAVVGETLTMRYSEALDEGSTPAAADFEVSIEGARVVVNSVAVSGTDVTLGLGQMVAFGDEVLLYYTRGTSRIQDIGGTDAASFVDGRVRNATPDPGPVLVSAVLEDATLTLTYSEPLDATSVPAKEDFEVRYSWRVGTNQTDTLVEIDNTAINGAKVVLTLSTGLPLGVEDRAAAVDYTPGAMPIQDEGGNAAAALVDQEVAVDTVPVRVTFVRGSITLAEGASTSVTLTLDRDPEREVVIPLTESPGAGALTGDFSGVPASVTFVSGQTSRNFTFSATEDTESEGLEIVDIELGTLPDWVSSGLQDTSRITIADNDPAAKVTGVTVTEQNKRLTIGWAATPHATGYKVQWKSRDQTFADAATDNRQATIRSGSTTTYVIAGLTNGLEYTVRVIATKTGAPDGIPSDEVKGTPVFSNIAPTGQPAISGVPAVGQTLTVSVSGIVDADGLSNVDYAYQWVRVDGADETEIAGATNRTHRLQTIDEGKRIRVDVSFVDDNGTEETLSSPVFPTSGTIGPGMPTAHTLVANSDRLLGDLGERIIWAQSFRTGANPGGYTITGIGLRLVSVAGVDPAAGHVSLRENARVMDGGVRTSVPGVLLSNLANPPRFSGRNALNIFAAPANIVLKRNTTYWVTLNEAAGAAGPSPVGTFEDHEDSGSRPGWEIGDGSLTKLETDTVLWTSGNSSLSLRITGYENAGLSALGLMDPTDSNVGFGLAPAFNGAITSYTAAVANDVASVKLTATAGKANDVVVITDDDDTNSAVEAVLDLVVGTNSLIVTVTAVDGIATRTYEIEVTRQPEPPAQVAGVMVTPGSGQLQVRWDLVSGATGYRVQWKSGDETFADAATENREVTVSPGTMTEYTINGLANGTEYTVRVMATKTGAVDGAPSAEVTGTPINLQSTGKPTISGDAMVGETLSADASGIMDAEGLAGAVYQYQWVRVDNGTETDISGATGATYRLRNPDANKEVKVRVSYEDDAGNEETVTSDAYPDSGILLGRVLVSNFEQAQSSSQLFMGEHVGNRYTQSQGFETGGHAAGYVMTNAGFVTSSWTAGADTRLRIFSESSDEPDALVHTMGERIPLAYSRDGRQAFVAPASAELEKDTTYFAVMDVTAAASFTNLTTAQSTDEDGDGATGWSIDNGSLFQDPPVGDSWDQWHAGSHIAKVTVWGFPKNTAATGKPAISGTATVGETLTASPGNIADTNGLTDDPSYVYRWIRRSSGTDTDIPGATGSTYQLTLADVGNQVKVQVAFVDDLLHEESRTSNAYPAGTSRIGAASSDTTLSALSIEDDDGSLTLVPSFDPATATYTADADRGTTRVTMEATPNDSDATIAYYPSSDADGGSDGHQVDLNFGGNELRAVVTAADTFTTQTYTVTVTRELPELSFENTEYTASEGSGEIIVAVVLSDASTQSVTVGYETQDATATAGEEYTSTSGTLTFAPGTMTQNITIPVGDDNVDEYNKVFRVYLVNPSGATLPSANYFASVEVQDDEAAPTATLADVSADESAGTLTLTLMLTHASESDIRYRLADGDVGGTASEPGDYRYDRNRTSTSAQITVPGGDLSSTFDMTVVDDDLPEDDETIVMRWERAGAGATPDHLNVTATITDNDDPERLVLSGSLLSVGEAGLNTFTVELATQPTHDVSVAVSSGDTGAATVSPTPLTFTTGDWDTAQTVTVSGVDDSDDRDETVTITLTASSTDTGYEGKTGAVSVSVADDDTAGLVLSRSSLTIGEAGSDSFTVKLGTRPASPVSLVVQSNDAAAAKVDDPQTLTINAGAWNTEQTVTVSGVDDADYNDENVTVTITATSGDAKYNLLTAPVSVIVEDDEVVPVTVNFEKAIYTVGEAGNVTVTVKLSADPERTVTITITRANQDGATAADYSGVPMNVTFNSGDTENAFTFSATQDGVDDDGESVKLGFGSTLPTGVTAGSPSETTVTITDDDTAGVSVSETALTVVEEDGTGDSYTVVLDTEPTADVTVTVAGHAGTDVSLDQTTLTFTTTTWSTAQEVTVTAGEDGDADDETDVTLSHAVTSAADTDYNGITAGSVVVSITDNDTAGVTVSETDLTIVEGSSGSYTVVLNTQPAGDVTVTVSGHAGTDASLDQTTLTFTSTTWSTAQTVTVTAGQDGDAADETDVTLSHAVASTDDAAYNGISAGSVVVSITDNDTAGVTVSETDLTIVEGSSGSYTVVLNTQPAGDVTVTVSGHASTDVSLDQTTLTFSATTWSTAQEVTVTAGQDSDAEDETDVTLSHAVSSADDAAYNGISAGSVVVSITDNDAAGVTVSETGLTIVEGSSDSYTVVLNTQPAGDVTVTVSGHASTDVSLDQTTLTFSATTWSTAQEVTVTAGQDGDAEDETDVTLSHAVASTDDAAYNGIAAGSVVVSITDNDTAGVTVSETGLTIVEGSSGSYTVVLNTQPAGDVTVTVSGHAGTDASLDKTTLTFTSLNWSTAQTVTVTAGDDGDADDETDVTLSHAVASTDDAAYNGISAGSVVVSITDNDTAGVTVSETGLTIVEGSSGSYTVALNTQPAGNVTVTVSGHAGTDVSLDQTTLTFTSTTWSTAQEVTVTAGEDGDADDETDVTLSHAVASTDDAAYNGISAGSVVVSITDNDTANSAPTFPSTTAGREVAENTAAGQNVGSTFTATDDDGDTLTYTLEGADAASFDLVTTADPAAQIRTKTGVTYNHEAKDTYEVVVKADDGNSGTDTITVTITVTDVNEPPAQPAAPSVSATTGFSTSLDVSWTPPATTGPDIDNYDLQYRQGTSGSFTNGPQNVTGATASIPNLMANMSYQVQVLATNAEGDSPWSLSGTGSTNSDDATLSALTVNDGTNDLTLDPTFISGTFAYAADVGNAVTTVTLSATLNDDTAEISGVTLGGAAIADMVFTDDITVPSLVVGDNVIVVTVTAEDTTTQTYTVTVTQATATVVPESWSLRPSSMTSGNQFRLLFLSSTGRDATPNNIDTYNTWLQNLAAAGHADIRAYSAGFKVVGCTAAVDAIDNTNTTGTGIPIYWLSGNKAVDTYVEFYEGGWDNEANKNESGNNGLDTSNSDNYPFTGCHKEGTEYFGPFLTSRALGKNTVSQGRPNDHGPGHGPIEGNDVSTSKTNSRPLYGLSGVFEVETTTLSTDATLSALTITDVSSNSIALVPNFDAATTDYTAPVANDVDEVTIVPTVNDSSATYEIQDASGNALTDADGLASDFQVALSEGPNIIKVEVTAEYVSTTNTYEVMVARSFGPPTEVPENWSLKPSGLSVGSEFRLIFLSSNSRQAQAANIDTYNNWIQNRAANGHADIQAYSSGFRVVGCTENIDARDNTATTGTGVQIYWLNGVKVADHYTDFYNGNWDNEANDKNEDGTNGPDTSTVAGRPYTGCGHNGTEHFDGTDSLALGNSDNNDVTVGRPNSTEPFSGPISSDQNVTRNSSRPMYGLSGIFKVAAASDDATLSALTVNDGTSDLTLDPTFAPGTYVYAATVGNAVTQVTLTATPNHASAAVSAVSLAGTAIADTTFTDGITVPSLVVGDNVIVATATAEDATTQTYTVTVTRATAATPTVSISADKTSAVFKEDGITYTLTRTGSTAAALPVTVTLTQTKNFLLATALSRTVTIAAGQSTKTFNVTGSSFQLFAAGTAVEGGTLTATVQDGTDYDLGTPSSVAVAIVIGVMVRIENASYNVNEADGTLTVKTIARTGPGAPQPSAATSFLEVITEDGTAIKNTDFAFTNTFYVFTTNSFSADGSVWEATRTVTVSITNDARDEDDETFNLAIRHGTGSTSFSLVDASGNSCGTRCTALTTIVDDDTAGVTVSKSAITVTEEDTTGDTYTVVLDSQPTANVSISIGGQTGTDVTAAPSPMTFTTTNWVTAQTVMVTAGNDADTVNDSVTLTHAATSTDTDYSGFTIAGVTVTVNDNDTANSAPVFSTTSADRSIAENTAAGQNVGGTFTATDSDGDTITYTLEGTDAASFDLVTTTDPAAQIRTKSGVTYNHEVKSTYTVVVKADDGNSGTDTITVTITITDVTEVPGRPTAPNVTATSGSTTSLDVSWSAPTNTGPAIDNYDLRYQKTTESTWTNGPQNQTGITAGIGSLDAGTAYRVQVRATNDEGDSSWSPSGTGTTTALATPTVSISADKTTAVFREDSITYTLTRTGSTAAALPVTVTLTQTKDFLLATELSQTVTIPAGQTTETFTVAASSFQHFAVGETVEAGTLTATVQDGTDYDLGTPSAVDVAIVIGITVRIELASYTVDEADGTLSFAIIARTGARAPQPSSATGSVRVLTEDRSASNAVDFAFTDGAENFLPSEFSADGGVWQAESTYNVSITNDDLDEDDETFILAIERSLAFLSYSLVDASGNSCGTKCEVTVTIVDDDTAGVTVSKSAITVTEEDTTGDTYTVVLDSQPTANVTITIGGQSAADITAAPSPLIFTTTNWATAQTVTVTADNDADTVNDSVTLTHAATSTDTDYSGFTIAGVTVTVNDNDTANNAPTFPTTFADRVVAENTAAGQNVGSTFTATDSDGDTITYTLEGTDAASFDLATVSSSAQIRTKTGVTYNFEVQNSYTVVVKADDGNGGTATVTVLVTTTDVDEPPGRPAAPAVSGTAGSTTSLTVSWTAPDNTGPDIDNYDLQYRQGTSGSFTNGPQNVNGLTTTIPNLSANTSYQVQVRATNAEGDSPWSPSRAGSTNSPPVTPPGKVTGVNITAGDQTLQVNWTRVTGATGYKVQWKSGGQSYGSSRQATVSSGSTTSRTITNLDNGTEYTVRVIATKTGASDGTPSDDAMGTPTAANTAPSAPGNLKARAVGNTRINLSWNAPSSDGGSTITGYSIQVSNNGRNWSDRVANTGNTNRTHSHTGLSVGDTRHYRIAAINSTGPGPYSNVARATTGLPQVNIAPASTTEGGDIVFTITISPTIDGFLSVGYGTGTDSLPPGSMGAKKDDDYVPHHPAGADVQIGYGQSSVELTFTTVDDDLVEGTEIFEIGLYPHNREGRDFSYGTKMATATIRDDENGGQAYQDSVPGDTSTTATISPGDTVINRIETVEDADWYRTTLTKDHCYQIKVEGNSADETLTLLYPAVRGVYRSDGTSIRNTYENADGQGTTAISNVKLDTTGTYYIAAGLYRFENGGTFRMSLTDLGTTDTSCGAAKPGGPMKISVADTSVRESSDRRKYMSFTVTLDRRADAEVSVDYTTVNGTAIAGQDYEATSGTVVFDEDDEEKTVWIPVEYDSNDEDDETLTLVLSNARGAEIEDGVATGTIVDYE